MNESRTRTRGTRSLVTFDTNLAGVWNTRVFWATLCEAIGQPMVLTPTATAEVLRRIELESELEWTKKLRELDTAQKLGWTKVDVRRLAIRAAISARNRFESEICKRGAIYATSPRRSTATETPEAEIEESIDDEASLAFDPTKDNGTRERTIVIEAMARGYAPIASDNTESTDDGMLRDWLRTCGQPRLGLSTTILRPEPAEEQLQSTAIEALEAEIEERIDDEAFDLTRDNGMRDRTIVIEAMARGYDLIASDNTGSIDHGMLRDWLKTCGRPKLGLSTTILRPEPAEEQLRSTCGKSITWTAHIAARACVSDPDDAVRAAQEIAELIDDFDERGMSKLKSRIERTTKRQRDFAALLESVARHGTSQAMRAEHAIRTASARAVSKQAGTNLIIQCIQSRPTRIANASDPIHGHEHGHEHGEDP